MNDRIRTTLAFLIIIAILFIWVIMSRPRRTAATDITAPETTSTVTPVPERIPMPSEGELLTIENSEFTLVLSTAGASVRSFKLTSYDIDIVPEGEHLFISSFDGHVPVFSYRREGRNVVFVSGTGPAEIEKIYYIDDDYGFKIACRAIGKNHALSLEAGVAITQTKNPGDDLRHFGVFMANDGVKKIDKDIKDSMSHVSGWKWFALRNKYFMLAVNNDTGVEKLSFNRFDYQKPKTSARFDDNPTAVAAFGCFYGGGSKHRYGVVIHAADSIVFTARLLPLKGKILAQYKRGYEKTIDSGILDPIAKFILLLLNVLYSVFRNYGVVIIVFAILVKLVFFPLSRQMIVAQQKMQMIQPELKKIQEKYKGDSQRLNQEMMHLYRTYKVNPVSGCLPLIIQMPIIIALYQTLNTAIEIRNAPFALWITDLSFRDPYYVLPITMGALMLVQSLMTTVDPRQRYMVLLMPVLMVVFFLNFPSGLQLYWFTYNLFTLAEHFVIKRGGRK